MSEAAADERHRRIAESAYFKAQARGFVVGRELDDWLEAEEQYQAAELDRQFGRPSLPASVRVSLRAFADTATAERLGRAVSTVLNILSRTMNLERLEGVTVAFDYDAALAEIDRGIATAAPATRTNDDKLVGVAQAVSVVRSGVAKWHLAFYAPVLFGLLDESPDAYNLSLSMIAHEAAHVAERTQRINLVPNGLLHEHADHAEDRMLGQPAEVVWEEYAACRMSAAFSPGETARFEQCFVNVLAAAPDKVEAGIAGYHADRDLHVLFERAGTALCEQLRVAAYLFGHLDGVQVLAEDAAPLANTAREASPYKAEIERLIDTLRGLWETREAWATPDILLPLHDVVRDLYSSAGIFLQRGDNRMVNVSVPFWP